MTQAQPSHTAGCLFFLVQATDSMRRRLGDRAASSKLATAVRVGDRLLDELRALTSAVAEDPLPVDVDVGAVAYRTGHDGLARFEWLLDGTSVERPMVPLRSLAAPAGRALCGEDRTRSCRVAAPGLLPNRAALDYARGVLARWAGDHPRAVRPLVVHCSDGESADGPHDAAVRAITAAVPDAFVVQCLFRERAIPSAFTPVPPVPSGDLWAMSSAMPHSAPPFPDGPPQRALLVNMPSSSRIIGEVVRRIWTRTASAEPVRGDDEPDCPEPAPAAESGTAAPSSPEPDRPPRLVLRDLWMAKRGNSEAQWEDGFAVEARAGVLAVADGASDGVFTKTWVELLLKSYLADPLTLDDGPAVERWLEEQRRAWRSAIRYRELRWSLQRRVDSSCGAATFLAFRLDARAAGPEGWTAWAVGDVCLFHVRDGRLIATFPVERSSDFGYTPPLYQSKALRPTPAARTIRGDLLPGDLIFFATDALAQSMLAAVESGEPPDWEQLAVVDQAEWREEIERLRDRGAIVNDDCTLLTVRLAPEAVDDTGRPEC